MRVGELRCRQSELTLPTSQFAYSHFAYMFYFAYKCTLILPTCFILPTNENKSVLCDRSQVPATIYGKLPNQFSVNWSGPLGGSSK